MPRGEGSGFVGVEFVSEIERDRLRAYVCQSRDARGFARFDDVSCALDVCKIKFASNPGCAHFRGAMVNDVNPARDIGQRLVDSDVAFRKLDAYLLEGSDVVIF